ncbi:zinc ABC transporter substrate-binding protein [Vannielia sp.]|uniref:zinc ABC transporter substrate-binding protein n=1 Tax=Vannielia sp. TaxID=2813045 RepID=UPI0026135AB3|nr:zinc ABC transporter substrate-binding protein [Vannielia sp.]MDF1872485.1 zinc ABC transporter substrate-binding protein [Vannielia sp.]
MRTLIPLFFVATPALAEPQVLTDLPPIHSLVAQVMEGVGTPDLLLDSNASGHGLSLRPSQAGLAENADLVFWVGPDMSPGLEKSLSVLARDAKVTALMERPETLILDRSSSEAHAHDGDEDHEDEHADHDDHDDHEEHADHDDHDEHEEHAAEDDHGHNHGSRDPHVWLDPENGQIWLSMIAEELAAQDPENAETYHSNATRATESLGALQAQITEKLAPFHDVEYLATHSAFGYFEARFHLAPAHALTGVNAEAPTPGAMSEVRHAAEDGITCLIVEPDTPQATIKTLTEDTNLKAQPLDPLGRDLPAGPGQYEALLTHISKGYASCLD